jgi:hypothetical protein
MVPKVFVPDVQVIRPYQNHVLLKRFHGRGRMFHSVGAIQEQ